MKHLSATTRVAIEYSTRLHRQHKQVLQQRSIHPDDANQTATLWLTLQREAINIYDDNAFWNRWVQRPNDRQHADELAQELQKQCRALVERTRRERRAKRQEKLNADWLTGTRKLIFNEIPNGILCT